MHCLECKGRGKYTLLTTTHTCDACGGTGRAQLAIPGLLEEEEEAEFKVYGYNPSGEAIDPGLAFLRNAIIKLEADTGITIAGSGVSQGSGWPTLYWYSENLLDTQDRDEADFLCEDLEEEEGI